MSNNSFTAHYWHSHSEHGRPFPTLSEAVSFLLEGTKAHEMIFDRVTDSDGMLIVSREELHRLLRMEEGERHASISSLEMERQRSG